MNVSKILPPALAISLLLAGLPARAADKTALALLPQATAEAKKWQADSTLVNINTQSASQKGTAPMWAYAFYSAKTKQKALIMADGAGTPSREESIYYRTIAVGKFSVDSDQAMATAVKNGMKTNAWGMGMNLESNAGKPEWRMLDTTHFYYVDALSGKFLRREATD